MTDLSIEIRTAGAQDIPAIIELMREFAEFESLVDYLEVTEKSLREVMFGKSSFVKGLIVSDGETPIAYAIFYRWFSSFRGQVSVYLEDIFITENYRKYGIGEKMLREVARVSKKEFGAVRMDFQVIKSNEPAINFYKKHGAEIDQIERHVKIVDEHFQKLTEK